MVIDIPSIRAAVQASLTRLNEDCRKAEANVDAMAVQPHRRLVYVLLAFDDGHSIDSPGHILDIFAHKVEAYTCMEINYCEQMYYGGKQTFLVDEREVVQ